MVIFSSLFAGSISVLIVLAISIPAVIILLIKSFFVWHRYSTKGMAYFGKPLAERRKLKRRIEQYGRLIHPFLKVVESKVPKQTQFVFAYQGIYVPSKSCSYQSLKKAVQYCPQQNDLFIVTPMRCGTTWMQYLAYEVLCRGQGDLSDQGHNHLNAMSPWLESVKGVAVDAAPLIGEQQIRIIKSHLPSSLCPYNEQAKYIYVTRHPVSCYASCVDYLRTIGGPFTPTDEEFLEWFCSEKMWWGSWPHHVAGYWQWAQNRSNVRFFHFEELKQDLPAVIDQVADFLGCNLTKAELATVAAKCSFGYMKEHEEWLEMNPPSFFSTEGTFFKSGSLQRHTSVNTEHRERILRFCSNELASDNNPIYRYYPDIQGGSQ